MSTGGIKPKIDADLKTALLSGDKPAATLLRSLKGAILEEEIAKNARDSGLPDEEAEKIIAREIKKRRESIEIYENNSRPDLAESEKREVELLEGYLPEQLSESEIIEIIETKKSELGVSEPKDMGRLIGAVKSVVGNSADGALVAKLVKENLG